MSWPLGRLPQCLSLSPRLRMTSASPGEALNYTDYMDYTEYPVRPGCRAQCRLPAAGPAVFRFISPEKLLKIALRTPGIKKKSKKKKQKNDKHYHFCSGWPALKNFFWRQTDPVFRSKESSDHLGITKKISIFGCLGRPGRPGRLSTHLPIPLNSSNGTEFFQWH